MPPTSVGPTSQPAQRASQPGASWLFVPPGRAAPAAKTATILMFAALLALQFATDVDPGDGVLVLYVLPVFVAGAVLGQHAGTAACITALLLCGIWDASSEADMRATAYAAGGFVFTIAGPVLGFLVDALRAAGARERATEAAFEAAETRLSRGFDLKEGLALIDTLTHDFHLPRMNVTLAELSGYAQADLARLGVWDLLEPRGETSPETLRRFLAGEAGEGPLEAAIRHRDGSLAACTLSLVEQRRDPASRYVLLYIEAAHVPEASDQPDASDELTQRELEILTLVAEGRSGPSIARELYVSPETVKSHLKSIYRKLGATDRAGAVAVAFRSNLIS